MRELTGAKPYIGIFFMALCLILGTSTKSYAQCSNPAGNEASIIFNEDEKVAQYCDDTNWIAMGPPPAILGPGLPSNGLVHHWKFDELTFSSAADSVGSLDGSVIGGITQNAAGIYGPGYNFPGGGTNERIELAEPSIDIGTGGDSAYSFCGWVNTTLGNQRDQIIHYNRNSGRHFLGVERKTFDDVLYVDSSHNFSANIFLESTSIINDGEWHHWCVVRPSYTQIELYVDGILEDSDYVTDSTPTGSNSFTSFWIGEAALLGSTWEGNQDDIRVYNRALSASEVAQCCSASASGALTNGLVGHWKLDETVGTTAIDYASSNNGTMQGGLDAGSDSVNGKIKTALDFNGSSDYVDMGAANVLWDSTTGGSVSFWTYMDTINSTGSNIVLLRTDQSSPLTIFYATNPLYAGINFGGETGFARLKTLGDISASLLNTWTHITVTYDGVDRTAASSYKLYINAQETTTESGPTYAVVANTNLIGDSGVPNYVDGRIDDVRVYERELSADEVAQLYRTFDGKIVYDKDVRTARFFNGDNWIAMGPVKPTTTGLVGHWKLDETSGTLIDSSANSNDGTQNGTITYASSGIIDEAVGLDGVDDYVRVTDSTSLNFGSGDMSAGGWIYVQDDPTGALGGRIIEKRGRSCSTCSGWQLKIDEDGSTQTWGVFDTTLQESNALIGCSGTFCTADRYSFYEWHHVMMVYSGAEQNLKVYVNGIEIYEDTTVSGGDADIQNYDNNLDVLIGATIYSGGSPSTADQFFNGRLDDIRLYNSALTPAQITDLYLQGFGAGTNLAELDNVDVSGGIPDDIDDISTIVVKDGYAYVGTHYEVNAGVDGYAVVDATDPSNISRIASIGAGEYYSSVGNAIAGNYLFYCGGGSSGSDGLKSIDISTPSSPTLADQEDSFNTCRNGGEVRVQGNYAYSTSYSQNRLDIHDISDPENLTHVGGVQHATQLDGAYALDVEGDYAYVAVYDGTGLRIVDISDETSPSLLGLASNANITSPVAVAKHPNAEVVYMGSEEFNAPTEINIIDVTNKNSPSYFGGFDPAPSTNNCYTDLLVVDNTLYAAEACADASIYIIDVSNATSPSLVNEIDVSGTCPTYGYGGPQDYIGIAIEGNYLYSTCKGDSEVITWFLGGCSDPSRPEGSMVYNADFNVMQYCDGVNWQEIGK